MEFLRRFPLIAGALMAVTVTGSAGCLSPPVEPGGGSPIDCSTTSDCPDSFSCSAGRCVLGSTVGDSGTGGDTDVCAAMNDSWTSFAKTAFQSHCQSCHNWASSYSGVTARASSISSRLSSGSMPPSGGLSAADRQRMIDWLGCGAPQ